MSFRAEAGRAASILALEVRFMEGGTPRQKTVRRTLFRRLWWTRAEVERYLGVSRARVRQLAEGNILATKRDRRGRISYHQGDVVAYRERRDLRLGGPPVAAHEMMPARARVAQSASFVPTDDYIDQLLHWRLEQTGAVLLTREEMARLAYATQRFWTDLTGDGLVQAIEQVADHERRKMRAEVYAAVQPQLQQLLDRVARLTRERDRALAEAQRLRGARRQRRRDREELSRSEAGSGVERDSVNALLERLNRRFPAGQPMPSDEVLLQVLEHELMERK